MNCLPALRIPRINFRSWTRPSPSVYAPLVSLKTQKPFQADNPAAAVGKLTPRQLQPGSSRSTASVGTLQSSTLDGTTGETVHFDVRPASLMRWQHRDKCLVNDTHENRPVRDPNLLSKRLPAFNHYVRKETCQWLRKQIRRQTKLIRRSQELESLALSQSF
jgi:hypothetical protein